MTTPADIIANAIRTAPSGLQRVSDKEVTERIVSRLDRAGFRIVRQTTGHQPSDYEEGHTSGWRDGYEHGYSDGQARTHILRDHQKEQELADAWVHYQEVAALGRLHVARLRGGLERKAWPWPRRWMR